MRVFILLVLLGLIYTPAAKADEYRNLLGAFKALPKEATNPENKITPEKVALGKKLYMETALSKANDISCNSCHGLDSFGVDNKPVSPGHKGQTGDRNSPTVYNAALHIAQFWDGRAKDVEEQALGPILNPIEMAMDSEEEVIKRLSASKEYPALFKKAFPEDKEPLTYKNLGKAIGAFERTLLTPSPFDAYIEGDDKALSKEQKEGLKTFVSVGCTTCHNGVAVGGGMYQKLGLVVPYDTDDLGRYNVTKNEFEKYFFKVPSLRNIEKTGPYFHDGSVKTIDEAISLMAKHQLGKDLAKEDVAKIITFLTSLTGEIPKQ